jgi:predicted membrane-bound spermidine synthase
LPSGPCELVQFGAVKFDLPVDFVEATKLGLLFTQISVGFFKVTFQPIWYLKRLMKFTKQFLFCLMT